MTRPELEEQLTTAADELGARWAIEWLMPWIMATWAGTSAEALAEDAAAAKEARFLAAACARRQRT